MTYPNDIESSADLNLAYCPNQDTMREVHDRCTRKEAARRRYRNRRQGHHTHMQVRINYFQKCTNENYSRLSRAEYYEGGGRETTKNTGDEIPRSFCAILD